MVTETANRSNKPDMIPEASAADQTPRAIHLLRQSDLFYSLTSDQFAQLMAYSRSFEMSPGLIYMEGDIPSNAYVLLRGRVDICLLSRDGRELLLHRLGPGALFGEGELLDGQPRSALAIARTRSQLLAIPRDALLHVARSNPDLAHYIIAVLSQRSRNMVETVKEIGFFGMSARLARILLSMDDEQRRCGIVHVNQHELASAVGCTRQSVTRTIAEWRRLGYVSTGRGYIRILDPSQLQANSQD